MSGPSGAAELETEDEDDTEEGAFGTSIQEGGGILGLTLRGFEHVESTREQTEGTSFPPIHKAAVQLHADDLQSRMEGSEEETGITLEVVCLTVFWTFLATEELVLLDPFRASFSCFSSCNCLSCSFSVRSSSICLCISIDPVPVSFNWLFPKTQPVKERNRIAKNNAESCFMADKTTCFLGKAQTLRPTKSTDKNTEKNSEKQRKRLRSTSIRCTWRHNRRMVKEQVKNRNVADCRTAV